MPKKQWSDYGHNRLTVILEWIAAAILGILLGTIAALGF